MKKTTNLIFSMLTLAFSVSVPVTDAQVMNTAPNSPLVSHSTGPFLARCSLTNVREDNRGTILTEVEIVDDSGVTMESSGIIMIPQHGPGLFHQCRNRTEETNLPIQCVVTHEEGPRTASLSSKLSVDLWIHRAAWCLECDDITWEEAGQEEDARVVPIGQRGEIQDGTCIPLTGMGGL